MGGAKWLADSLSSGKRQTGVTWPRQWSGGVSLPPSSRSGRGRDTGSVAAGPPGNFRGPQADAEGSAVVAGARDTSRPWISPQE